MGVNVVAADLDPQSNLTSMFLEEDRLEELWPAGRHPLTIQGVIDPVLRGTGDIQPPHVEPITVQIGLLAGDLDSSGSENLFSQAWPQCHVADESAFRAITVFYRAIRIAAESRNAKVVLIDLGPNLGAINRAALIASTHVVIPLGSDLYSARGLRHLGPQLRTLRANWRDLRDGSRYPDSGEMEPAGYVVTQHAKSYGRWAGQIPAEYSEWVLGEETPDRPPAEKDPHCLGLLRNYRSLMPLAQEAHKPMFLLKPADGAIGAHAEAVRDCYAEFRELWRRIVDVTDPGARFTLPSLAP
jgi:cellulose biosynthesis protein BcsQ